MSRYIRDETISSVRISGRHLPRARIHKDAVWGLESRQLGLDGGGDSVMPPFGFFARLAINLARRAKRQLKLDGVIKCSAHHHASVIGKVIDLHRVEAAALADTLDEFASGVFIVDSTARIIHATSP